MPLIVPSKTENNTNEIAEVPAPTPPEREDIDFIPQPEIDAFNNSEADNIDTEVVYQDELPPKESLAINTNQEEVKESELPTLDEIQDIPYEDTSDQPLPIHPAIDYAIGSDKEEAQKLAYSIKDREDLVLGLTKDPEYTLELTEGLSHDMASRQLEAVKRYSGKVDPSMFIEGNFSKNVEFSEKDFTEYEAVENFKRFYPTISKAAINPLEAKVISRDRALQDALAIYNNEFGSTVGNFGRGIRSGVSGVARSVAITGSAPLDNINEANQKYLESIEKGGTTLEEDKVNAQIADIERSYDTRIEELDTLIDRYKTLSPETAKQYSAQRIALGVERDSAVEELSKHTKSMRDDEIENIKSSVKLTEAQMQATKDWIDNTVAFNHSTPSGFIPAVGSAIPQFLSMVLAPETAAPLMFTQGFSEAYEGIRNNGGSATAATSGGLANAFVQYFLEQTGVNFIGNFKKVANDVVKMNFEKAGISKLTGELVKNISKGNINNALKVIPEEVGVEVIQGLSSGMVQETALIAEDVHTFEEAAHNFATNTLQQAATEGAIAGILTAFLVPGTVMSQIRRARHAAYLRGKGEKIAKSFSESKIAQEHPEVAKDIVSKVVKQKPEQATTLNQNYDDFELGEEGAALAEAVYDQAKKTTRVDANALAEILNTTTDEGQNKVLNMMGLTRENIKEHIANGNDMIEIDTVDFLTKVSQTDVGEALLNHVAMPNMEQTFAQAQNLGKVLEQVLDDTQSAEEVIRREGIKRFFKKSVENALPDQPQTVNAMVELLSRLFVTVDKDTGDYNYLETLAKSVAVEGEGSELVLKPKENIRDIVNRELRQGARTITSDKAQRERERMVAKDKKLIAENGNLTIDKTRRQTSVYVNGESLPAEFAIVPADRVTASHNEHTFEPNPEYEAAGHYNQRNYHSDKSLQESLVGKTEPERLISNNVGSNEGTPITDKDGFVMSGNNRSMRMKRDIANSKHQAYSDFLTKEAPIYGYSPEEVAQIPNPMLIRVLKNDVEDKVGISAAFNSSVTLSNDIAAEATKRGNLIGQATINSLSKMNDGENLGAFISNNQEAVFNALRNDGVIEDNEISDLFDRRYNRFTEIGRVVAKSAFLGKLITDLEILHSLNPANAAKITEMAHIVLATGRRSNFSLIKDFQEVAKHLSALQNPNIDWPTYTNNNLFGESVDPNANSVKLAKWLMERPVAEVRKGLSRYLKSIPSGGDTQSGMFELDYDKNTLIDEMITPKGIKVSRAKKAEVQNAGTIEDDVGSLFPENDVEQEIITHEPVMTENELKQEAAKETELINSNQSVEDIVLGNDYYHVKNAARSRGIDYQEILGEAWENAQKAAETFDPAKGDLQKRIIDSIYRTAQAYSKNQAIQNSRESAYDPSVKDIEAGKNTSLYEKAYDKMNKDISKYLAKKHKELKKTFDLSIKGLTQEDIANKIGVRQGTVSKHLDRINSIPEVMHIREEASGMLTLNQAAMWNYKGEVKEFVDRVLDGDLKSKAYIDIGSDYAFAPDVSFQLPSDIVKHVEKSHPESRDIWNDIGGILSNVTDIEEGRSSKYHGNSFVTKGEYSGKAFGLVVEIAENGKGFITTAFFDHQNSINSWFENSKKRSEGRVASGQARRPRNGYRVSPITSDKRIILNNPDSVNKNSDEGTTLNQGKRGEIKLYPNEFRAFIKIFKDGKADTVIHEFSHLWLDHVNKLIQGGIIDPDSKTGQIFSELMNHYGKDTLNTDFHEDFAEDLTQYVINGKAPAPALINAFRVIRKAVLNFYKFFKQKYGKNNLSPEITDIFNRMLATDDEIEYMGKYYEYTPLAQSVLDDVRARRKTLHIEKNKRLKKEAISEEDKYLQAKEKYYQKLTNVFKNNGGYAKAIDEAVNAVNNMPVYKTVDSIIAAGRLDYKMIKDLYGSKVADALKRHKKRVPYTDKNGNTSYKSVSIIVSRSKGNAEIDLSQIAKENGFDHESESEAENMLIQALVDAPEKAKVIQEAKSEAKNRINTQIAKAVRESTEMLDYDMVDQLVIDKLLLEDEADTLKNAGESIEEAKIRWQKRLKQARMERKVIDNQGRDIINKSRLSEAIDYKNFRQQLKKAIRGVDSKLKEITHAREKGDTELEAQLLSEAAILQKKRTIAYVAVRHSIHAFHNWQNSKAILQTNKLAKKIKNINNKYAQSIVDILYTWNMPAVQNNEKLFRAANISPDKFSALLIIPEEATTPLNEVILFNPSELIPNWMKEKEASSVETAQEDFKNISYEQFDDISSTLKMLLKKGRKEFVGMKDAKIKTIDEAAQKLKENTDKHRTINPNNPEGKGSNNRFINIKHKAKEGFVTRVKKLKRTLGADFAMMEFIFREMDDYEVGYFTENFFDKFMDSELEFRKRSKVMKDKLNPHLNTLYAEMRRLKRNNNGNERFNIEGVVPPELWIKYRSNPNFNAHFTAENIIALCFNMGNDGNLYSVVESLDLGGEEFREYYQDLMNRVEFEKRKSSELQDPDILEEASSKALYQKRIEYARPYLSNIQSMLSTEGWNAIQNTWDSLATIFPNYQKAFYATTGRSLPEEQATPLTITTADGSTLNLNGGYYPLKYDFKVQGIEDIKTLDAMTTAERKAANVSQGINKDATHMRNRDKMGVATVRRMPQLEVSSVLSTHIADTLRYSTHAVISNDFDMLLRNKEFKETFVDKFGEEKYQKLSRWALRQARPDVDAPKTWFEKKINSLRSINTVAVLGMNAKTAIKQLLSIPLAMNEMSRISEGKINGYWSFIDGVREVARGMNQGDKWHSNGAMDFVREASDYIRFREDDAYSLVLSDFTEKLSLQPKLKIAGKKIGKKELAGFSFSLIRTADRMAVMPIWLGAFNQSLEMNGVTRTEDYKSLLNPAHPQSEIIQKCIKQADRVVRSTQPSTMAPDLSHAQSNAFYKLFTAFSTYTLKAFNRTNYDIRAWRNGKLGFDELMHSMFDSYVMPSIMSSIVALLLLPEEDEPETLDMILDPAFGQWKATVPFLRSIDLERLGSNPLDITAIKPAQEITTGFQQLSNGKFMKGTKTLTNLAGASIGLSPKMMLKSGEQIGELLTQGELDSKKENRKENK